MRLLQKTLFNTIARQKSNHCENSQYKTITVSLDTYQQLASLKKEFRYSHGGFVTFNSVIHQLLLDHQDCTSLRTQIQEQKVRNATLIQEENGFLKELLLNQSFHAPTIQMAGYPQANYLNPSMQAPPPPPPSIMPPTRAPRSTHKRPKFVPPNTGDLKKDYIQEIHQVFTGEPLKPSQIAQTTQPKHLNAEISTISDSFEVPSIEGISVAKSFSPKQKALA